METCLVPDHEDTNIRVGFFFKLPEERIDRVGIQIRRQQSDGLAGLRTSCSEDIEVLVLCLPPRRRSSSPKSPLSRQCSLLAEPGLILKPDFDFYSRMINTELPDLITDFFLKALRASGLPFGCSGRDDT